MGDSKNLYALPVVEKGKSVCYYCLLSKSDEGLKGGSTFAWILLRGQQMLSSGACGGDAVSTMLEGFRVDLNGGADWIEQHIH